MSRIAHHKDTKEEVKCKCWCELHYVMIPLEWVRQGKTLPCSETFCLTMAEREAKCLS